MAGVRPEMPVPCRETSRFFMQKTCQKLLAGRKNRFPPLKIET
jgi:hypothetical protein